LIDDLPNPIIIETDKIEEDCKKEV
jgi:hypothetical protein